MKKNIDKEHEYITEYKIIKIRTTWLKGLIKCVRLNKV